MKNTDFIAPVKIEIARGINKILGPAESRIYVNGGGIRCALSFAYETLPFAQRLNEQKHEFTLNGHELVKEVHCKNRNIYFEPTEELYTLLLRNIIDIGGDFDPLPLPAFADAKIFSLNCPRENMDKKALAARVCYVQRRMWMLSRRAEGEPDCGGVCEIKRALLLTAIMLSGGGRAGGRTRILDACDALLNMTRAKRPPDRQARAKQATHTAAAAVKALTIVYNNFIIENKDI